MNCPSQAWFAVSFALIAMAPANAFVVAQAPKTAQSPQVASVTDVTLSIRFADGKTREFRAVKYREDMTVLDLMEALKSKDDKGLKFEHRGSGASAFLTSIDGVANGKGRGAKYWIFRVNGKLGDRSFGTTRLKPGDTVLWHHGKYEPE